MPQTTSSYDLVAATLSFQKVDRVPVFLLLTTHGAKELGLGIKEYFSRAEYVVEGQQRLQQKYRHDCVFAFFHAGVEAECFGVESVYVDNGSANLGPPVIRDWEQWATWTVPDPVEQSSTRRVLGAIELFSKSLKGRVPIVAAAGGPFAIPIYLMGLEGWLELLLFGPRNVVAKALALSKEFCVGWVNAQLNAGADIVVVGDPFLSSSIVTREEFVNLVLPVIGDTVREVKGPVGLTTIGPACGTISFLPQTGAVSVLVTSQDDLGYCRELVGREMCVAGNMNNVAMVHWSREDAVRNVQACLAKGAGHGGFILAPEWEIPFGVPDEVLMAMVDAARCKPASGGLTDS